jgi:hypothetical protein
MTPCHGNHSQLHSTNLLQHNKQPWQKPSLTFGALTHATDVIEVNSKIVVFVAHPMNIGDMSSNVTAPAPSFTEQDLGLSFVTTLLNYQSTKIYGW